MNRETLATELLSMRKRAERTIENIDQISRNLSAERQSLREVVKEYSAKRVELLKEEFQARRVTWCTSCSAVIPESETELLLLEGKEKHSHGYGGACYSFRDFSRFHRACRACCKRFNDLHGQKGSFDSQAKDQSSFYVFYVEKRDDGHYARKFGNLVKLDDENCKLNEPSSQLIEQLIEKWNLPPRIEVEPNERLSVEDKLIVHERALAEAS